ncbi:MAG: hypothetical protein WC600_17200 [Desulfobaccales bacterium]
MAAGHQLADLKDGYTIAQVELFSQALAVCRTQDKLEQAEAVAWGIIEAWFPKEHLLSQLRQALLNPGAERPEAPAELKPEIMASLYGGLPLAE